ncbi:MAG: alpha-mannosidase, partial [Chloroflexota bacterium]
MKHHIRWTPQKITARLRLITPLQHRKQHAIAPFEYAKLENAETDAILGTAGDALDWTTIPFNSYWGEWSTNFMMRTTFTIPDDWEDDAPIVLYLPFGDAGDFVHPEALAYIDGQSYASVDRHHHEILLPDSMRDGQVHTLELHGWTGLGGSLEAAAFPPKTQLFMSECYVVQIHQPTRDFVAKVRIVLELARLLPEENPVQGRLMNALDDAFIALDTRDPIGEDMFYDSLPSALATLQVGIDKAGEPLDVDIVGVGHAHIDVAWMWQLSQTRRKAGRTFSNVLRIMEQFPEYHFSQSQAQLYRYIEESYPDIFEQIKARVAEGRWEVILRKLLHNPQDI